MILSNDTNDPIGRFATNTFEGPKNNDKIIKVEINMGLLSTLSAHTDG